MKTKKIIYSFIALLSFSLLFKNIVFSGPTNVAVSNPEVIKSLKKYMQRFGSLVAGLEILRVKENEPDWEAIDLSIKDIESTISEMQKLDKDEVYKQYTGAVAVQIAELKKLSKKKDKKIYDGFDKLTNACFQCHAAHRPADFLKNKDVRPLSGK